MGISVLSVAKALGKDPSWVRAGIITGYLPIGTATRNGKKIESLSEMDSRYGRISYYISPKLLFEETGLDLGKDNMRRTSYRLMELRYFCKQYKEWEEMATKLENGESFRLDPFIFGRNTRPSDPTGNRAIALRYYKDRMDLVKSCCDDLRSPISSFIFESVTDDLDYTQLTTRHGPLDFGEDEFLFLRKRFFKELNGKRL